jgi:hypothetical protein
MKRMTLAVAVLLLGATNIWAQRCGDSLLIFLHDKDGRVIAPADFESAKVSATYTVDNVTNLVDAAPEVKELPPGKKSFAVRVECGIKRAQFRLKYKGEEMTIRILNVPGDAQHILLDGILFRKGTYEVDLGGRPLNDNVEEYKGEGSTAKDPADEIKWVVRDKSLRKVG